MGPGGGHGDAAARRAGEEAELDQVGLVDIHDGVGVLGDGGGEGVEPDGSAIEALDQGAQQAAVVFVEAELVDAQAAQGLVGDGVGDDAVRADLGEVSDPSEQPVGDSRRASGALGEVAGAGRFEFDLQGLGRADDDRSSSSVL